MKNRHRSHALWLAFIAHRLSGATLAVFLPVHFYVLSFALTAPAELDSLLRFTDNGLVKAAETGLVFLFAVHAFGGLRLLAFEALPYSAGQKTLAAGAVAVAVMLSGLFLLRVI